MQSTNLSLWPDLKVTGQQLIGRHNQRWVSAKKFHSSSISQLITNFFNTDSDKGQYYRATLSVSSDTVPQLDFLNIEQDNWVAWS